MQTIYIVLYFYFIVNSFFVGHNFDAIVREGDDLGGSKFASILGIILAVVIIFLFGLIFLLYEGLSMLLVYIDNHLCIRFFFFFLFTKKYHNLDKEVLVRTNQIAQSKQSSSLNHRMFRYCTSLVNKRNNFIYD